MVVDEPAVGAAAQMDVDEPNAAAAAQMVDAGAGRRFAAAAAGPAA